MTNINSNALSWGLDGFPLVRDVDAMRNQLVYRCSHDMITPLKSISGLISLIEQTPDEKEALKYLDLMTDCVKKVKILLKEVHEILDNDQKTITVKRVGLRKLVSSILTRLKNEIEGKGIRISTNIEVNVAFHSDPLRLSSALHALISNAIIFCDDSKADKRIEINVMSFDRASIVTIKDNGIGMNETATERLFQPFFRASEKSRGVGLGLFMVDAIVKRLGGTIKASSKPSQGSSFTIWLPNLI